METIQEKVAARLSFSNDIVVNTVVDKLVEIEVTKRVDIISRALVKIEQVNKDFAKINGKCDTVFYTADQQKVISMSQKRFDEIEKLKVSIENLNKAFNQALELNNTESYNKLNGLLGGNKQEGAAEVKTEE